MPSATKDNKKKGNEAEVLAVEALEKLGYQVHRCIPAYRPIGRGRVVSFKTDIFGRIDIIAKRVGERTLWIQVTAGDTMLSVKRKDLEEGDFPWDPLFDNVQIWLWKGVKMEKGMTRASHAASKYFQIYRRDDEYKKVIGDVIYPEAVEDTLQAMPKGEEPSE